MTLQFSAHYSKWPLKISLSLSSFLISVLYYLNFSCRRLVVYARAYLVYRIVVWFKDLIAEFTLKGWGSQFIIKTFKVGFIIFIFSEVIFFIRFFWTYFHFILLLSRELGRFPGTGLICPDYKFLGLFNTFLLLRRGVSLATAHLFLVLIAHRKYVSAMRITIFLGLLFVRCQLLEYKQLLFIISDSSYARIFYLTTRFHGAHVLVGLIILFSVYLKRFPSIFLIFELGSWYWHFVDVVWLFLFSFYYWLLN